MLFDLMKEVEQKAGVPASMTAGDTAWAEWAAVLYHDFASFAARSFRELNPRTPLAMNWHFELAAGKLAAVREVRIRRLIVCLPPRHLKSHLASIAFRRGAWVMTRARRSCASPPGFNGDGRPRA
jgi:hypothetical protein